MLRRLPVFVGLIAASGLYGQVTPPSRYGSPSGFGNINFPGVGHPPAQRLPGSIASPGYAGRLGASVRGYPGYGVAQGVTHPSHNRQVIVPVPIVVGGYGYGYGYDALSNQAAYQQQVDPSVAQQQQPATPPVVIINQSYRPDASAQQDAYDPYPSAIRRYDSPGHPLPEPADLDQEARPAKRARVDDSKPTIYLIAFKDHTILPALAYWVEGDTLNYITQEGQPNRASLTLIDRDFSKQLNTERSVEFALP